jgi:hypothetical protein
VIRWSDEKDRQLRRDRGVSLETVAAMISRGEHKDVLKHPTRENQWIFILDIARYTWVVPFVVDEDGESIFLKTAFPS